MPLVRRNSIPSGRQLESWYATRSGQYLLARERHLVDTRLRQLYGDYQLQLSLCRQQALGGASPVAHKILVGPGGGGEVALRSTPDCLPFANDSIDVVIAHHVLEFAEDPHALLRELHRVVAPQGHIIILAFNPWSLFGAALRLRGLLAHSLWRQARPMSAARLRDWLQLLGARVLSVQHCYALPPFGSARSRHILARVDARLGVCGGVFVLRARKQLSALTPGRRRLQPGLISGLAVPKPVPSHSRGISNSGISSKGVRRLAAG